MSVSKLISMLLIAVAALLTIAWIAKFQELTQKTCNNPATHDWRTYACHCPDRWLGLTGNAIIQGVQYRIPPCEGWNYWVVYQTDNVLQSVVSAVFAPSKLLEMVFHRSGN